MIKRLATTGNLRGSLFGSGLAVASGVVNSSRRPKMSWLFSSGSEVGFTVAIALTVGLGVEVPPTLGFGEARGVEVGVGVGVGVGVEVGVGVGEKQFELGFSELPEGSFEFSQVPPFPSPYKTQSICVPD